MNNTIANRNEEMLPIHTVYKVKSQRYNTVVAR